MGEKSKVLIKLFGVLDVTGEVVVMWAILALFIVLALIVRSRLTERPGRLQNMVEAGVEYLESFFADILGHEKSGKYFYFLSSLFVYIVVSNLSGLLPGVGLYDFAKAPTASLAGTLGLGLITFLYLQYTSLRVGCGHYFSRFIKPIAVMLPILLLDEFIKPLSLSLRLFGNVFGEETVIHELYNILPVGLPTLMMGLSIVFSFIQAVVFTMLVSIYLDEGTEIEEPEAPKHKKVKQTVKIKNTGE